MVQAQHFVGGGVSGSGKTTLLREAHENFEGVSVFVNHGSGVNDYADNIAGYRASGRKAMQTAVGKYERWNDVRINLKVNDPVKAATLAANFARDLNDSVNTRQPSDKVVPVQILIDEAHLAHEGRGPIDWILSEGRDKFIKLGMVTQNPKAYNDDDDQLLNAPYWLWVGEPPEVKGIKGWLQYYEFPLDQMPSEPYEYVVLDRSMNVLYEGTTKEEYA